jgi:hypothetical protein
MIGPFTGALGSSPSLRGDAGDAQLPPPTLQIIVPNACLNHGPPGPSCPLGRPSGPVR